MRSFAICLGFIVLAAGLGAGVATAKDKLYHLRPVETVADQEACGRDKGRGAMVFALDLEGNPVGDFETFCVLAEK